jgi:hypothetical protein
MDDRSLCEQACDTFRIGCFAVFRLGNDTSQCVFTHWGGGWIGKFNWEADQPRRNDRI